MIRLPDMKSVPTYGYSSLVADDAEIGPGTRIGNFVFIRDRVIIGAGCSIGSYVDIEGDVRIGKLVSLQSGCYLTRGVIIEDEVFCGPRVVTLNDKRMCYRRPALEFRREAPRIEVVQAAVPVEADRTEHPHDHHRTSIRWLD